MSENKFQLGRALLASEAASVDRILRTGFWRPIANTNATLARLGQRSPNEHPSSPSA